ncbi:MAG: alpha/beta hydrolase [Chloroflexales bacterium]|nr:alpha/beta hydrolase [Chloroflexales bacterium]
MSRTPIVFVPGFSSSFNLLVLLDIRGPTLSGWNFPPFVDFAQTFLEGFRQVGYKRNTDLFVAFYDWRKSVKDIARDYLIPWIDRAREKTNHDKVILVCHSMGGLVARSYIQSRQYRNDVERLITLGTPHRGSADAYYPWGGGELRSDPTVRAVFNVYLWFLEHFHPFQTSLDRLQTIRTQVMGVRDLLPIDDYLFDQDVPLQSKPEDQMHERNAWVELLNAPENIATLFDRVPVTTISGSGFPTVQSIIVGPAPSPPSDPLRFPDGEPVGDQTDGDGDGTVALRSARLDDPRVNNLPPVVVQHHRLVDEAAAQVMSAIGIAAPELQVAEPESRLVIMTASPINMTVEPPKPAPTPGVLGAAEPPPPPARTRRMQSYRYGHEGKRLGIMVVPQPELGVYNIQLAGTTTGCFAMGAMMIGPTETPLVLGTTEGASSSAAEPEMAPTKIRTTRGQVASGTELYYQIECTSLHDQPQIRFDAAATTMNAMSRMKQAMQTSMPGVLGSAGEDMMPQLRAALGAAAINDPVRERVDAALTSDDTTAIEAVAAMLQQETQRQEMATLLHNLARQVIGPYDPELVAALAEQLKQIADLQSLSDSST